MKILILVLCIFSLGTSTSVFANSNDQSMRSVSLMIKLSGGWAHYCHANSVYLFKEVRKSTGGFGGSLVWDHEKGKPLKCEDYSRFYNKDRKSADKLLDDLY